MGITYDFSIKDTEDATPVDAGIEGWDAIIQINEVVTRRYAAQGPFSLLSRQTDFRGSSESGNAFGLSITAGIASDKGLDLLDIGSITGPSNASKLLFIPTMIGLMIHPLNSATMNSGFSGYLSVQNGTAGTPNALTTAFPLAPPNATLANTIDGMAQMPPTTGSAASLVTNPTSATAPSTNNAWPGYYYFCPIVRGLFPDHAATGRAGTPLRGYTVQNTAATSPFYPDGTAAAGIKYASTSNYTKIKLHAVTGAGASDSVKFAIVDLYGMIIPGTP